MALRGLSMRILRPTDRQILIGQLHEARSWVQNLAVKVTVTGAFWVVFLLFSWTAPSIVFGAVIKRTRYGF
jgi:hypothetical protein